MTQHLPNTSTTQATSSFDTKKWIGCGRKFPEVIGDESEVQTEWTRILAIPKQFRADKPQLDPAISISDFIQASFPRLENAKIIAKPQDCFSKLAPPEIIPESFGRQPIPPYSFTTCLLESAGQAWLDGYTAVADWRYQSQPLPFWILTYWKESAVAIQSQREWSKANLWLKKLSKKPMGPSDDTCGLAENVQDMQDMFRAIGWGVPLKGAALGLASKDIAYVLSPTSWIREDVLNAFVELSRSDLDELDEQPLGLVIETTDFARALQYPLADWQDYEKKGKFSHLSDVGKAVEAGAITQLLFPACIKSVHWAIFDVDISARTVKYGDSLGWSMPSDVLIGIKQWLSNHHINFSDFIITNTLERADQTNDNFSCGIIASNTIDHALLNTDLWTVPSRDSLRISKVIRLFDSHLNMVRIYD